jgi:hypothetical protein
LLLKLLLLLLWVLLFASTDRDRRYRRVGDGHGNCHGI